MEFILRHVQLIVTNIIHISKFPVQQLNILISGGTGKAFFSSLSEEATAILHVFWVYAKRFPFSSNSPHSLSKPPRQISLNALLTPTVSTHSHIYTNNPPYRTLSAMLISPPAFAPWLSQRTGEKKSVLIWQSEQPFHRASPRSVPVPEWELLISPGRLACRRRLGSPGREGPRWGRGVQESGLWSGLGRRQIRAPRAASVCTSLCRRSSVSLCLHTLVHAIHTAFPLHTCEALIITLAFWWVSLLSSGKDKSKTWCLYWVWNH